MDIVIIDYGAGNIKSIDFAFKRLGIKTKLLIVLNKYLKQIKLFSSSWRSKFGMKMLCENNLEKTYSSIKATCSWNMSWHAIAINYTEEGHKWSGVFNVT